MIKYILMSYITLHPPSSFTLKTNLYSEVIEKKRLNKKLFQGV